MSTPIPATPIVRQSVYAKGGTFDDDPTLLWYARAVKVLQDRPLADRTSWRFYAGIHDFDLGLWQAFGFWEAGETKPSAADRSAFWQQCQHGSWYFLPWHRGYLLALESMIRAIVADKGGPADWALPYWNYFGDGEDALPPAFATPEWPDGANDNPLFVGRRYGPDGDGVVSVPPEDVDLRAMNDRHFVGRARSVSPGFGGPDTGFSPRGGNHGGVESMPHDQVHGSVGGLRNGDNRQPGLMSTPQTAGLDPIFYLHHANIDRLWEAWRRQATTHTDPTLNRWLTGPAQRAFAMPLPGGPWTYTATMVRELTDLNYSYDDLTSGTTPPAFVADPAARRERLGAPADIREEVTVNPSVELVGANDGSLPLPGTGARTTVRLDPETKGKVTTSLVEAADGLDPDRVFLNLENIRGPGDGVTLRVYVGRPEGADAADPEATMTKAGTVGLFGVTAASESDGDHAGQGFTAVLEITDIVDALHLDGSVPDDLDVAIVPRVPYPPGQELTIGRVSVFREGR